MTDLTAALEAAGLTPEEIEDVHRRLDAAGEDPAVLAAWVTHLRHLPPPEAGPAMTAEDAAYLAAHSGLPAPRMSPEEAAREVARRVLRDEVAFYLQTYSEDRVAAGTGLTPAQVRTRVDDGRLSGYPVPGQYRIPAWQFRPGPGQRLDLLPGLEEVLAADPADVDPRSLAAFMTLPDSGLDEDVPGMTPADYLHAGGDVGRVVFAKSGIVQW